MLLRYDKLIHVKSKVTMVFSDLVNPKLHKHSEIQLCVCVEILFKEIAG